MAIWLCSECGKKVEGRCRPKSCPACKAPKEKFEKEK
jgi:rubrerythrin